MRLWLIAIAAVVVVAAACDQVPLTSPTGSTITLSIDKSIVPVNGQATITAVVTESAGTAVHNGTMVTFLPTLGRVDPAEAQTVNGRAVATYIAPNLSGTATINAYSGSASTGSGNTSSGGVQVRVGSAGVGTVSVSATPSGIPRTGGLVTVTARVLDAASNPLPGASVAFSADAGTLSSSTVITDASGIAATTLNTNRATRVTATVGDKSGEFTVSALLNPTVTIAVVGTTTPTVNVPVAFTITPGAATNSTPTALIVVDFGDGQSQSFPNPTGPFGTTHAYSRAQGYTVTATATDVNGSRGVSSVGVVVVDAPSPVVTLSASPNPVPIANNGLTTITVGATSASSPIRSVVVRTSTGTVIYSGTGGGAFSYQFGTFPGGATYTLTATATDALGNVGTITSVVVVQ